MKNDNLLKTAKTGYIAASLLLCIAGILLMLFPNTSMRVVCIALGIGLMVYGIVKISGYLSRDLYRLAFQFDLASGILLFLVGLWMITKPDRVISMLYLIMGILILADGLLKIQIAIDAKKFGLNRWGGILIPALFACIAGLLLMLRPFESAEVITVLLGLSLLIEGILNLAVSIFAVKIIRYKNPELFDADGEVSDDE